jgi:hypothetical protein
VRGADVLSAMYTARNVPKIRKRQRPCGLWRFPDDLLAQWIMHRPVLPVDEAAGCPASSILPLRPGCVSRLPLPRSLSAEPASESSGCPSASSLRLCRRWSVRVAPNEHAFGVAGFSGIPSCPVALAFSCRACDEELGSPLALHLRLYRRWVIESPRCSHHSAVPTCRFSGCPKFRPFGIADDSLSELPRTLNPPVPIDGYPSYLGSRTIRFASVESPGCPGHFPLGYGNRPISTLP